MHQQKLRKAVRKLQLVQRWEKPTKIVNEEPNSKAKVQVDDDDDGDDDDSDDDFAPPPISPKIWAKKVQPQQMPSPKKTPPRKSFFTPTLPKMARASSAPPSRTARKKHVITTPVTKRKQRSRASSFYTNTSKAKEDLEKIREDFQPYYRRPVIAFLFSTPLVDENSKPIPLLDSGNEEQHIRRALHESHSKMVMHASHCSVNLFKQKLDMHGGVRILHYMGHGEQGALLFEDAGAKCHRFKKEDLEQLFKAGRNLAGDEDHPIPDLVVVSACYSERIGRMFVDAGVPHVVAINRFTPMLDNAGNVFAYNFYYALFNTKTVQEAFDAAVAVVKQDKRFQGTLEWQKFKLLPDKGDPGHHQESITTHVDIYAEGGRDDGWSSKMLHSIHYQCRGELLGRNLTLAYMYEALHPECEQGKNSRCIKVKIEPGYGSSTLVSHLCNFLSARGVFDMILNIELPAPSTEAQAFIEHITHAMSFSEQETDRIMTHDNLKTRFKCVLAIIAEHIRAKGGKSGLVTIDGVGKMNPSMQEDLRAFIQDLLKLSRIKVIFTSCLDDTSVLVKSVVDKTIQVERLSNINAIKILRQDILTKGSHDLETWDLLTQSLLGPYPELSDRGVKGAWSTSPEEDSSKDGAICKLAEHKISEYLEGSPKRAKDLGKCLVTHYHEESKSFFRPSLGNFAFSMKYFLSLRKMSSHDAEDKNYEDIMAFAREVCKNDRATLKSRRNAWKKDDTYYLLHGYRYILSAVVFLIVFAINFTAAYQNAVTKQLGKNISKNKFHSLDTDSDGCMEYSEVQSSFMIVSECVFESMKRQQTFDEDNDGCLEIDEVFSLRQQFFASNLAKRTKSQFREWLADPNCVPDDDVNDKFSVPIKTNVYAGYQLWNIANRSVMRDSMNEVLSQFDETWRESLTLPSETNISPAPTGKNANNGLLELLESFNLEHLESPLHDVLEISSTDDMQYFLPQDCQLLRDTGHPLPLPMCRRLNAVARKSANWHHTDIRPDDSQQLKPSTKIKLTYNDVDSIIHSMCLELRNEGCLRKQFPWKIFITISVTTMCIFFPFVM